MNSSAAFDSAQALTLVDKSIANSQLAMNTINRDDASLRTAANNLNALPWLTLLGRGSLDGVATRIAHARKALAAARAIASDEMLDGRFWSVLYGGLADFTTLNTQSSAGDVAGARSTLVKMKAEIDQAAQLSGAPGLPADLHDLMADIQTFVGDYGNKLDAQAAGDDVAESTAETNVDTDVTEIGKYDIDKIGGEIDSFYKPMIDRFNSEIAAYANQTSWPARRTTRMTRAGSPNLETANQPAARINTTTMLCNQSPTKSPMIWRAAALRNLTRPGAA